MKRTICVLLGVMPVITICCVLLAPASAAESGTKPGLANPFFAFDNGVGRGSLTPEQQATILADLGYDGIGYSGAQGIPELLKALDARELKLFSIYVGAVLGPDGPKYDPGLKEGIKALKGRDTLIWFTLRGRAPDADEQSVRVLREVADLAAESGLRVALYPHVGFHVATTEDALRIVKLVDRDNVGVSFNLCHFLKLDKAKNIDSLLERALPHLFAVSINGADHEGDWDRLIQTLDRGEFDLYGFLKTLKGLGYEGPVGLQCYQVPGDIRDNLGRSIRAWKSCSARMAAERE